MDSIVYVSKKQTSITVYPEVPPPQTIIELVRGCGYVEVDTETDKNGGLYTLQLGIKHSGKKHQYVIEKDTYPIEELKPIFSDEAIIKILQNAKFDHSILHDYVGPMIKVFDTFIAEVLITNGYVDRELGLGAIVGKYCGVVLTKEVRGKIIYQGLTDEVIEYAAKDVRYLHDTYLKQVEVLTAKNIMSHFFVESQVTRAYAEMERVGIRFNTEGWKKVYEENKALQMEALNDLNKLYVELSGGRKLTQTSLFDVQETVITGINWNSPAQVKERFRRCGHIISSSKADVIAKLKKTTPLATAYLKYKDLQTQCSKFGIDYLKHIKNGRLYFDVWQCLDTMRVAIKEPNVSQIPQNNKYRNCFMADEGWVFVDHDYSSQELALIAADSQDPAWLEALTSDYDLHSVAAEIVFKSKWKDAAEPECAYYQNSKKKCDCKEHKLMRNDVKTVNYSLSYGAGADKLSDVLSISKADAEKLIKEYFQAFPALKKYFDSLKKHVTTYNSMRSMGSIAAIRHFNKPNTFSEKSAIEREGMNARIQMTGACIMKYAVYLIMNEIPKQNYPVRFVMTVHDAIVTTTPIEYAEQWSEIQKNLMIQASMKIVPSVFIGVDASISPIWKK